MQTRIIGPSATRLAGAAASALVLLAAGPAWCVKVSPPVAVTPLPAGAATQAVVLTRAVVDVPKGLQIGELSTGPLLCIPRQGLTWTGASGEVRLDPGTRTLFNQELARAGFKTAGDPSLFEGAADTSAADLEVGVEIRTVREDICYPFVDPGSNILNNYGASKGSMQIDADWQVYSRLQRKVVARVSTSGGASLSKTVSDAPGQLMTLALAENLRALLNSSEFRAAATAPVLTSGQLTRPGALAPLKLTALAGSPTIADSVGSVVAVFAGGGMGSGFVVGDGYLITNHHVVGEATTVKVKWPDGLEFAGEVVRSDARRDVALIKTDTRGRPSLALRMAPMQPGDTVFAIGTPLDPNLQNTVTRGVVSAMRTFEGFAFIQSDVSVNHGNSGGPLLDEKAKVVGLTVWGYEPNGAPAGLNFFIPIRDAMDFLALSINAAG